MTTPAAEIRPKSAGPAGASIAAEPRPRGFKIRLVPFVLEDYLDALEAKSALADPENKAECVAWATLKEQLGL